MFTCTNLTSSLRPQKLNMPREYRTLNRDNVVMSQVTTRRVLYRLHLHRIKGVHEARVAFPAIFDDNTETR